MLKDMSLPKFDIYQGLGSTNSFKSHTEKIFLMSDLKFTLSDATSHLPDDLSGLKKIIFRPEAIT